MRVIDTEPTADGGPDVVLFKRNIRMHNIHRRLTVFLTLLCAVVLIQACSRKSSPSTPEHIRGTIQTVDGDVLTVATSTGSVRIQLAASTPVATAVQSDRAHITDGSFLGITSVTAPDGSQRAVEVHVFPEAMRGAGEGSYGWDWPGASRNSKMTNGTASKMTNGTVSKSKMTNGNVKAQPGGSLLTLQYRDGTSSGSQTITSTWYSRCRPRPGTASRPAAGVHVFVVATRNSQGVLTANRVLAGKNGTVPPM